MTEKKTLRRYIYEQNEREITEWAETMIKEQRIDKARTGKPSFPYYFEMFVKHMKNNAIQSR